MLPFAIIREKKKQQPAQPIVWHSRHYMKIHGLEINQPKPKVHSERHPYRQTQKGIRDSFDSSPMNEVKGRHIIDLNRQNTKGFRVGQGIQNPPRPNRDSYKNDNNAPRDKRHSNQEDRGSRSVQGNTHQQEEEVHIRQYNFRLDTEQSYVPTDQKLTFTEQIVNHYGNGIYPQHKIALRTDKLPSIRLQTKRQSLEPHVVMKLYRQLGIFQKQKQFTDEYVQNYGGRGSIRRQDKTQYIEYPNSSNDQVVNMIQEDKNKGPKMIQQSRSSGPWKEGSLEGSRQWKDKRMMEQSRGQWKQGSLEGSRQWRQKKQGSALENSRDSKGSGSRDKSSRHNRVKIFSTQHLEHLQFEPVHSEYMNGSSGDKKSREGDHQNIILEQSQIQQYEERQLQNGLGNFVPSTFLKSKYSVDMSHSHSNHPSAIEEVQPELQREQSKKAIEEGVDNRQLVIDDRPIQQVEAMSKSKKHKPIFQQYPLQHQEDCSPPIEPIKVKKVVIWSHGQPELPEAKEQLS